LPFPPENEIRVFIPKIWTDPPIVITVPRQAIDSNDTQSIIDQLYKLLGGPTQAREAAGRLGLSFEGFGKSSGAIWYDEVWQVPEARSFVDTLNQKFPFFVFMADLSGNTLYSVAACVCRIEVRGAQVVFNKEDLLAFVGMQFIAMDQIFKRFNFPEEEKSARVEEVAKYFDGVPVE
jgi:hypothetical protein